MRGTFKIDNYSGFYSGQRSRLTGASEIAAVVGASDFLTRYALAGLKLGKIEPDEETPAMRRGRLFEPTILRLAQDEHPEWNITPNTVPGDGDVYFDDESRLCASPDAIGHDEHGEVMVFDAKSVQDTSRWQDGPPLAYQMQVNVAAHLVGASRGVLLAMHVSPFGGGIELEPHEVVIDPSMVGWLTKENLEFWRLLDEGHMPDPDYSRDAEAIAAVYAESVATHIDLSGNNKLADILAARVNLKKEIAEAGKTLERIDAAIKHAIGEHETATCGDYRISFKSSARAAYTVPPSIVRRLLITNHLERKASR